LNQKNIHIQYRIKLKN